MALGFFLTQQQATENLINFAKNALIEAPLQDGKIMAFLVILNVSKPEFMKNLSKIKGVGTGLQITAMEVEKRITRQDFNDPRKALGLPVTDKNFDSIQRILVVDNVKVFMWSAK